MVWIHFVQGALFAFDCADDAPGVSEPRVGAEKNGPLFGLGVRGGGWQKDGRCVLLKIALSIKKYTLLEINISHLRKRKIIFKIALLGGYVSSLEGILYLHE